MPFLVYNVHSIFSAIKFTCFFFNKFCKDNLLFISKFPGKIKITPIKIWFLYKDLRTFLFIQNRHYTLQIKSNFLSKEKQVFLYTFKMRQINNQKRSFGDSNTTVAWVSIKFLICIKYFFYSWLEIRAYFITS